MEFPLKAATNAAGELAGAYDSQLRILNVPRNSQPVPVTGNVPAVFAIGA